MNGQEICAVMFDEAPTVLIPPKRIPRRLKKELVKALSGSSKSFKAVDIGGSLIKGTFPVFLKPNGDKYYLLPIRRRLNY